MTDSLAILPNRQKKTGQLQVGVPLLSFFTGGGFLDMGFEQAGFQVAWTNEVNPEFARMYEKGMTLWRQSADPLAIGAVVTELKSVSRIPAERILRAAFPAGRPKLFGIIGGPPCPDFSNGGKHKGKSGKHGQLTQIFVNRICSIQPHFFVFENVPGLYRTKIHSAFLKEIETHLEKCGFNLDLKILNSLEFGVPQDRERLFVIGVKNRLANLCAGRRIQGHERGWFPWPRRKYANAKARFCWPDKVPSGRKPILPKGIPAELTVLSLLDGASPPAMVPNGTEGFVPYSKKFSTVLEGDTKRKSFKRLHRYRFSPTACYGHNEVHLHPWENRRLTVREAMRIQGIPDTYALPEPEEASLSAKFALIANGVPVPLARHVAVSLRKFLTPAMKTLGAPDGYMD